MARSTDPKKALWERRFRRFVDSNLSVARFCAAEGVSEASFYYWRKKLRLPKRPSPARAQGLARFHAAQDAGAEDRGDGSQGRRAGHPDATGSGMFKPVTVVPATCGVVVRLPGGARIEVDATHLDAIRAVVAETVRADHDLTTGQAVGSDVHDRGRRFSSNNHDGGRRSPSDNHLMHANDEAVSC